MEKKYTHTLLIILLLAVGCNPSKEQEVLAPPPKLSVIVSAIDDVGLRVASNLTVQKTTYSFFNVTKPRTGWLGFLDVQEEKMNTSKTVLYKDFVITNRTATEILVEPNASYQFWFDPQNHYVQQYAVELGDDVRFPYILNMTLYGFATDLGGRFNDSLHKGEHSYSLELSTHRLLNDPIYCFSYSSRIIRLWSDDGPFESVFLKNFDKCYKPTDASIFFSSARNITFFVKTMDDLGLDDYVHVTIKDADRYYDGVIGDFVYAYFTNTGIDLGMEDKRFSLKMQSLI